MKALIAMSGGVDSATAAYLMKEKGFDCVGCTMRLFDASKDGTFPEEAAAKRICDRLGIPFYVFDYRKEFRETVINGFIDAYFEGKTPNPCVLCNRYFKFGKLLEKVNELDCDVLATGHYARIVRDENGCVLQKALDPKKDQSYVLCHLRREDLSRVVFPLGDYSKDEVRRIAASLGFENAEKKDSQDICFLPDGKYAEFIEKESGKVSLPGNYVDSDGNVLGKHKGIVHYTLGQHKKLGISTAEPLYVCRLNVSDNTVLLGRSEDLFKTDVRIADLHFIDGRDLSEPIRCEAKIRYRHTPADAVLTPVKGGAVLHFDVPQRAPTPGQTAVFYDGDTVLGGGVIS